MPLSAALQSAQEQLAYWKAECDVARSANDAVRIERCERYIAQLEATIQALIRVQADSRR